MAASFGGWQDRDRPIFVLTGARSGSTLLRFILDSHPDLACPPETGVGTACNDLAIMMGILDGLQQAGVSGRGSVTAEAATAIRKAVDRAYGKYLARRGRRRWCDKSLSNVFCADLLAKLWPEAQFLCMARHAMDVIASGLEVCPWGVSGYGFGQFAAHYPGNSVAAIGAAWLASTSAMLRFRASYPDRCHLVRYEDLVSDPEGVTAGVLRFLGARQVPGITERCLSAAHEASGPGDEKIWFTSAIGADSVGRGVTVPAALLPATMRMSINDVLTELRYRTVEAAWGTTAIPADPRADVARPQRPAGGDPARAATGRAALDTVAEAITDRTACLTTSMLAEVTRRWPALAGGRLGIVAYSGGQTWEFHWRLPADAAPAGTEGAASARDVTFAADADTWLALLDGANMATEIVAGRVRCAGLANPARLPFSEAHALAELLGLGYSARHEPAA